MITYEKMLELLGLTLETVPPKQAAALKILASGTVPAHAVKTRDGRAGKVLSYYKHDWARQLLRDALGPFGYSMEVMEASFHLGAGGGISGSTSTARVRLTVFFGDECTTVTELGGFDNTLKLNVAFAMRAAVGRALCACLMQMFGLGAEFYPDAGAEAMDSHAAWASIKAQAAAMGLTPEEVQAELEALGFVGDALGRRYEEAVGAVQALSLARKAEAADPVVETGKALGAKVVTSAEADMEAALEDNATADDALVAAVAAVKNWGEFYGLLTQTMGYPNGTAVQKDINAIFGAHRPQKDDHPDWELIYGALRKWKDAGSDQDKRDAVKKEYGPEKEDEDEIPF